MRRLFAVAAVAACLSLSGVAVAAEVTQAEIAFWQSIQDSTNPDEFQAYLDAYPDGAFAELAQLRISQYGGDAPAPTAPKKRTGGKVDQTDGVPAAPAEDTTADDAADDQTELADTETTDGGVVSDAIIVINPAKLRVGKTAKVTIDDMPDPGSSDTVIVVDAGAPDSVGVSGSDGVLSYSYASNLQYGPIEIGPLAPGSYEVRWLTSLYNNDNRLEVGARTSIEVSR